jgi:hypothetical protein
VDELKGRDLTGRTLWLALVLNDAEVSLLRSRAAHAEDEGAALVIASIPMVPKSGDNGSFVAPAFPVDRA